MTRPVLRRRSSESGHALGLAVVILLLLSTGASLLALDLSARLRADREAARALELRLLGDAAIARALAALDESGVLTQAETPFGRGSIESEGRSLGTRRWVLKATATIGRDQRQLEIEVVRSGGSLQVVRWQRVRAVPEL